MFESKISLYWVCQFLGWGSVALYWSYFQINDQVPLLTGVLSVLIPAGLAIGYTHFYRNLAHRYEWVNLPIRKLIPVITLAWIAITGLYTGVAMLNSTFVYGGVGTEAFLGMFTGGTRYAAIWLLAFHLYHFSQYRSRHELRQIKGDMLNLEAQYQNLNAELNPHFLFNALNSIKALTIEDPAKSRKAVDLLSDILRKSIHVSKFQKIQLSSEIERVQSYLELEQMRFEERLSYTIDISSELQHALLPPLSLLNLVENAVKHGIEKNLEPGTIDIKGYTDQGHLIIEVINTGYLFDTNTAGVGIKNTKDRFALLYKEQANLLLETLDKNQVMAQIKIPLEYD